MNPSIRFCLAVLSAIVTSQAYAQAVGVLSYPAEKGLEVSAKLDASKGADDAWNEGFGYGAGVDAGKSGADFQNGGGYIYRLSGTFGGVPDFATSEMRYGASAGASVDVFGSALRQEDGCAPATGATFDGGARLHTAGDAGGTVDVGVSGSFGGIVGLACFSGRTAFLLLGKAKASGYIDGRDDGVVLNSGGAVEAEARFFYAGEKRGFTAGVDLEKFFAYGGGEEILAVGAQAEYMGRVNDDFSMGFGFSGRLVHVTPGDSVEGGRLEGTGYSMGSYIKGAFNAL